MDKALRIRRGFTLVEVIVVAVIVAVLALVAIQLYRGYVTEARRSTAENLGSAAAEYLQSALNATDDATVQALASPLAPGNTWQVQIGVAPDGTPNTVLFTCPANAQVIKDNAAGTVQATVGGQDGSTYRWR